MTQTILLACAAASLAVAQSNGPWTFEVASVKARKPNVTTRPSLQFLPGGTFTSSAVPLKVLIGVAWNVGFQSVRLTGGPSWLQSYDGFYDIEAKAPQGAIPAGMPSNVREQRMKQMLQALLKDRFKLQIRTETKELPAYAVVVAKNGPKLEPAAIQEKDCPETAPTGTACHTILGGRGRGLHGKAVTIQDILSYVENWTDRPLVNETGLQGLFKVETRGWRDLQPGQEPPPGAKAEDGSDMADVPTLFAVFEGMGLKLEARKEQVEIYIIDHVERPTEN